MGKLEKHVRKLHDPRAANASYPLQEILVVTLALIESGVESDKNMADFGRRKIEMLRRFLTREERTPSHDVFTDIFRMHDRKPRTRLGSSRHSSPNCLILP